MNGALTSPSAREFVEKLTSKHLNGRIPTRFEKKISKCCKVFTLQVVMKNAENMCFCSKSPRDTIENRVELDRILNTTVFEKCSSIAQECIDTSGLLADDQGTTNHHLSNRYVPKTRSCLTGLGVGVKQLFFKEKPVKAIKTTLISKLNHLGGKVGEKK